MNYQNDGFKGELFKSSEGFNLFQNASVEKGLSSEQVRILKSKGLNNVVSKESYKTVWQIVFDNVFTFFNLIFFVLSLFLLFVRSYKDMLFMLVILANTSIGIFQQIRSKIKLDKLNLISSLKTVVVRDGKNQTILNSEIVQGDIIVLKTGDQITVDCVVLNGSAKVDESLLTGEADPITKGEGAGLLSGSFVLSGSCFARVVKVGANCYANRLTLEAKKKSKSHESEMTRALNRLLQLIGVALVPIGCVTFVKEVLILHHDYYKAIQSVSAMVVGMIPEGLYLLTSVALAMSVVKLIESKTLVNEMSCIETLARVNVLCVDKTGTITQPKMEVVGVFDLASRSEGLAENFSKALRELVFNMPPDSETAAALRKKFVGKFYENEVEHYEVVRVHHFLSSVKWFAVEFKTRGTFLLGAPEFILKSDYSKIENEVEQFLADGKRVLLFARVDGFVRDSKINGIVYPVCLVLIENPVRSSAKQTFEFFKNQGVEIKVISGDNPVTVSSVCRKVNLENASDFVDASTLKTYAELEQAAKKTTVFGRVSPSQKKQLVEILQKKYKKTVAMTGDGVNDVLALRQADVGVAFGSGSNAASQAAAIVLLDSDFAAMPKVVHEGRRVINNIERSAALFLVKNIFSFCFAFITLFFKIGFPITPFQFSCVSFLTIGMPSFLLTLENKADLIRGKFLVNVFKKALPGGICNVFNIVFIQVLVSKILRLSEAETSAICVIVLVFNGLAVLFELCRPINFKRGLVIGTTAVVMVGALFFLIFSSKFSYFDFFSNYFVLFLTLILFVINYLVLKFLETFFSFKIFAKLVRSARVFLARLIKNFHSN